MWSFAARLVDHTEWHCETCGDLSSAPVLIGDATPIAPLRALSSAPALRELTDQIKCGSLHGNRVLVDDSRTRELIYRFCGRPIIQSERKIPNWTPEVRLRFRQP